MNKRYLAIDHGDKRIGIALSDPTGTIASPLQVIKHISRIIDAAAVAQLACDWNVDTIVLGMPLDSDGNPGPQARKVLRFADEIRMQTNTPLVFWDESYSTQGAQRTQSMLKINKKKRNDTVDTLAATIILQSFLEHIRNHEGNFS